MNKKALSILIGSLLSASAYAQGETWDYTNSNADFDASMTLSQALPENGTTDVTAALTALNTNTYLGEYTVPGEGMQFGGGLQVSYGTTPVLQFTTTNGAITAYDLEFNMYTPGTNTGASETYILSSANGDYWTQVVSGLGCMPPPGGSPPPQCIPMTATGTGGSWVDPAAAPELDVSRAGIALTLFAGLALVLRGRRA